VTRVRLRRILWIGAAAILVAAALVAATAVLRGGFSETDGKILVTLGALLYAGGTALAGLALADRGQAGPLGRTVAAASPLCFGAIVWAVWFGFGAGNETADKLAWSAAISLLAALLGVTALLLARTPGIAKLAGVAGVLASLAALLSIVGVWRQHGSDTLAKALAVSWIAAALAYFLVPVLQRLTRAAMEPSEPRVLGVLGDVELVATRTAVEGTKVEAPAPGERLVLRRRV